MSEKKTNILEEKKEGRMQFGHTSSDVSVLYEIIRSDANSKIRKNAARRLLAVVEYGQDVDADIIKALFDAEKDIVISGELKRILNKLKLLAKFSNDPVAKFDRKLTVAEEEDLEKEISRLRGLYDSSQGEKGSFARKYKIIGAIAEGGMGRILKGTRKDDNYPVAIKFLMLDKLSKNNNRDRIVARFKREGELLTKRLRLANIIEAYEYGEANGEYFLVMEYVDGGTLEAMVKEKPLDLDVFKSISLQLCNAVEYLHRNGIIHRDIKPANILFASDSDGSKQLKLCDFGLSKDKRDGKLSRISFQAGTDDYSSPQQLADARTADERDDIFSMGKTFYQMLTCRSFKFGEEYLPITKINSAVPAGLDIIVRKCIETDKEKRFQGVAELRERLT